MHCEVFCYQIYTYMIKKNMSQRRYSSAEWPNIFQERERERKKKGFGTAEKRSRVERKKFNFERN